MEDYSLIYPALVEVEFCIVVILDVGSAMMANSGLWCVGWWRGCLGGCGMVVRCRGGKEGVG